MSIQDGLLTPGFSIFSVYLIRFLSFDLVLWVVNHRSGLANTLTEPLSTRSSAPGHGQCPEPQSTLERL